MANPLISKLERFARLSLDEHAMLNALAERRVRQFTPREHVIHEGDRTTYVNLIVDGWAHSYKTLRNGHRQIVALLVPGDLCDPYFYLLGPSDYSIAAVTSLTIAQVPRDEFETLTSPGIALALRRDILATAAIQREWTVSIGRRGALERVAHLMLEMFYRMDAVGLVEDDGYDFPLRQIELADALGMTAVHANRMLQILRRESLIELHHRRLAIRDRGRLERVAMFNPSYLHLHRNGRHPDDND